MSIPKYSIKIKGIEGLLALGIVLALMAALFGALRLSREFSARKSPTIAESRLYKPLTALDSLSPPFTLVASKKGTKYYASTCGSVKQIKPENLITFKSREEAESKKYTAAANCPDLRENMSK